LRLPSQPDFLQASAEQGAVPLLFSHLEEPEMMRSALVCLLFGVLAWSPAANPGQDAPTQTVAPTNGAVQPKPTHAEKVAPNVAVITINGLCEDAPAVKAAASGCKLVFTRTQFEAFADLLQPNLSPVQRRELATNYADALILAQQAREMGLDKGPRFEELMKLQGLNLLRQLLTQALQEKASQISDKDIADYYQENIGAYEEIQLQRLYIPLNQQLDPPKGKLTTAEMQKRQEDSETAMKKEADELHTRALAGEDFATLQQEAYKFAQIKTAFPPSKTQTYRRRDLTPAQVSVMNMKSGEISPVIKDANGYFFYKAGEKDTVPQEKVRAQITGTLRSQRFQQYMKEAQQSATAVLNEEYFTVKPSGETKGMSAPDATTPEGKGPGAAE
jgi:hypothetical protein